MKTHLDREAPGAPLRSAEVVALQCSVAAGAEEGMVPVDILDARFFDENILVIIYRPRKREDGALYSIRRCVVVDGIIWLTRVNFVRADVHCDGRLRRAGVREERRSHDRWLYARSSDRRDVGTGERWTGMGPATASEDSVFDAYHVVFAFSDFLRASGSDVVAGRGRVSRGGGDAGCQRTGRAAGGVRAGRARADAGDHGRGGVGGGDGGDGGGVTASDLPRCRKLSH